MSHIIYQKKLLSLGVDPNLLSHAITLQADLKKLWISLQAPMRNFNPPLEIKYAWQLYILGCPLSKYDALSDERIWLQKDNNGSSIAHYAAWSGRAEALEWVRLNKPKLLDKKDNHGLSVAHHAAQSGSAKALEWVKLNKPKLVDKKDDHGLSIAHHAARSGSAEALEWVKSNNPNLLEKKDSYSGRSIAHYAAQSGSTKALEWMKLNKPKLLDKKDNHGLSIAHHAARSGSAKALEWVKLNNPNLLNKKDSDDLSIAHHAVSSGSTEALKWVKSNNPNLLDKKDSDDFFVAHYAALSSNAEALAFILSSMKQPNLLNLTTLPSKYHKVAIETLNKSLDKCVNLTATIFPETTDSTLQAEIEKKLSRNKAALEALPSFTTVAVGRYQSKSDINTLCNDVLSVILGFIVPQGYIEQAWSKIYRFSEPGFRFINQIILSSSLFSRNLKTQAQRTLTLKKEYETAISSPEHLDPSIEKERLNTAIKELKDGAHQSKIRQIIGEEKRTPISILEAYAHPKLLSRYGYTHFTRHHMGLVSAAIDALKSNPATKEPTAKECLDALKSQISHRRNELKLDTKINPTGTLAAVMDYLKQNDTTESLSNNHSI